MPSTYTVNLGIEKPATGEQSGTWGDTTNVNFDIIDQAVNGSERVTLTSAGTSGSPNDLNIVNGSTTSSEGRNKWIEIYSASDLGGSAYVRLVPNDAEKILFIRNSLAGSQSILLFQGTYNASNDLEIPAGVDMVVKFDGAGASATVTDVFTKLRATEITTPTLTAGTADINGGSVDGATIGAASASTGAFTTLTASTSLNIASSTTVDGVLDEDNMASDSATKLATQQSIKAYVDSQVGTVDTLAEILANGNTSGANNLIIDNGQALTSNTINETTAGSGVTIDSVLLKDDVVNATDVETSNISANDGTAAATIANSTGNFTITNFISNSVDIGGGAIDGTVIGGTTTAAGSFTTLGASGLATLSANLKLPSNGAIFSGTDTGLNHFSNNYLYVAGGSNGLILKGQGLTTEFVKFEANQTVFNEDSNDTDFRVESDGASHMLFVDAGNNRVGIGEASPDTPLHITTSSSGNVITIESTDAGTAAGPSINLFRNSSSPANNDLGPAIFFRGDNSVGGSHTYANIFTQYTDVTDGAEDANVMHQISIAGQNRTVLGLTTSEVTINDESQNLDFRVESDTDTHALFVDASASSVGINTSLNYGVGLHVNGATNSEYRTLFVSDTADATKGVAIAYDSTNDRGVLTAVDVGTGWKPLIIENTTLTVDQGVVINETGANSDTRVESDNNTHMLFVDASADRVQFGKSSGGNTQDAGVEIQSTGFVGIAADGIRPVQINRLTDSGDVIELRQANLEFGVLGVESSELVIGTGNVGMRFADSGTDRIIPRKTNYTNADNAIDLGDSGSRWRRLYLSDGLTDSGQDGSSTIFNEGSTTSDFRIESNNQTYMFFVDGGLDRVGIQTSTPQDALQVSGVIVSGPSSTNGGTSFVQAYGGNGAVYTGDYLGNLSSEYASGDFGIGYGMRPAASLAEFNDASTYFSLYDNFSGGKSFLKIGQSSFDFQTASSDAQDSVNSGLTTHGLAYFSRSAIIFNENSKDIDFRVESDTNTHAFFVQGSGSKFGFNESDIHSTVDIVTGNGSPGDSVNGVSIKAGSGNLVDKLNLGVNSTSSFGFINAVKPGTNNIVLKIQSLGGGTVFNENANTSNDFRVESAGRSHMLFVDSSANMVGIGEATPDSTLVVGAANTTAGLQLHGGPNGNARMLEMVDGKAGTFTSVTIDVQFPGAGGWVYEVQIGSTFNIGGFQAGGGYTNGTLNFTHTTNAGGGWTVSSPSNNLIRFVTTNIGTHPVIRLKVVSSLTSGGPDMDDVTITFA